MSSVRAMLALPILFAGLVFAAIGDLLVDLGHIVGGVKRDAN